MRKGWIAALAEDKALLEELGIQLGEFDYQLGYFPGCRVTEEAMQRLKGYSGCFTWGLRPVPALGGSDGKDRGNRG